MKVIITEKPSVAKDIANVLGVHQKQDGYFIEPNRGIAITWAFGHLLQIMSPNQMGYSTWSKTNLPMCPDFFPITPRTIIKPGGKQEEDAAIVKQISIIKGLFDKASEIICATDAGREGELIFRYIYYYLKCNKPVKRLWISSLTDEAIKKGFNNLKDSKAYDNLYLSAKSRAEADWLVGLNGTQALSVATNKKAGVLSLGRVQTPTLAMICKRYEEHSSFESKLYNKIIVALQNSKGIFYASTEQIEHPDTAIQVLDIINKNGVAITSELNTEMKSIPSPLFYDLTYLQQEANIKYGFSADLTLKTAQKLYENKLITYPRTSSRYISEDVFKGIPDLIRFASSLPVSDLYTFPPEIIANADTNNLNRKAVDDTKIGDHHAILPTGQLPITTTQTEQRIYDLIVSKMLQAVLPAAKVKRYHGIFKVDEIELFATYSESIIKGWTIVRNNDEENDGEHFDNIALKNSIIGEVNKVVSTENQKLKTKPKPLLTEATLLKAMENCSSSIDDEILSDAIKGTGIGTPATRASIIELLFKRDYIERKGKSLKPSSKGLQVYEITKYMKISQPLLTGEWEHKLLLIEQGSLTDSDFINGIKAYTCDIVTEILDTDYSKFDFSSKEELICPKCKTQPMKFYEKVVKCTDNNNCGFYIYSEFFGNKLSKASLADLITKRKTKKLKGFFSEKKQKKFEATLILDEHFKVKFDF